jgi:hypothetical protein
MFYFFNLFFSLMMNQLVCYYCDFADVNPNQYIIGIKTAIQNNLQIQIVCNYEIRPVKLVLHPAVRVFDGGRWF